MPKSSARRVEEAIRNSLRTVERMQQRDPAAWAATIAQYRRAMEEGR